MKYTVIFSSNTESKVFAEQTFQQVMKLLNKWSFPVVTIRRTQDGDTYVWLVARQRLGKLTVESCQQIPNNVLAYYDDQTGVSHLKLQQMANEEISLVIPLLQYIIKEYTKSVGQA